MFTFHWSELLFVAICGLILALGLAFLMLRRRNELLQKFLTPDDAPYLQEEFFRAREPQPKPEEAAEAQEATAKPEEGEAAAVSEEKTAQWGSATNESKPEPPQPPPNASPQPNNASTG